MMPIVNGLEAEFGNDVAFFYMNAADQAEGQQAFQSLSLPGHPAYVIFTAAGRESYRSFGVISENSLQSAIENALSNPVSTDTP